jgi:hypothetical protein
MNSAEFRIIFSGQTIIHPEALLRVPKRKGEQV